MDQNVFQDWLDRVGRAVLAGDFDTYVNAVSLPFTLVTETSTLMVDSADELRQGFDAYHQMLQTQKVTRMVRTSSGVVSMDQTQIVGNYTTQLLASDQEVAPPFESSMILRLEGGVWKAHTIVNSTANRNWPVNMPRQNDAQQGTHHAD